MAITISGSGITSANIADDAVGLAEMASGTDGNIISYDASGNPVAIATGSDGQVLTSTGAGSPPAFETAGGVAAGLILPFGNSSAPTGFLACDGSAISRTTYATLFAAIATVWGVGDGSSTFNVPDLRGAFLRGVGTSTGFTQDHTTTLAALEDDASQGHYHRLYQVDEVYASGSSSNRPGTADWITYTDTRVKDMISDGTNGTPRVANETRPNNVGVQYCIKY